MSDLETDRLPPGQGLIRRKENWPVVGERAPRAGDASPWRVSVCGLVGAPQGFSLEQLAALPQVSRAVDFHCVTRWSKFDMEFKGPRLMTLIEAAAPDASARHVRLVARSDREHDTGLSLAEIERLDPLLALSHEGGPVPAEHGGPVRVITSGKYGYKSLKWLETVELRAEPALGYWERGPGYHDNADPWAEERYVTGNIPPDLRARMIERRGLGGRSLLSVDFSGEDLDGLDGRKAELRNCRFDGARLARADFTGANLSNASLRNAGLAGALFIGADLEGADFSGADLSGAEFAGASLFGASFCEAGGANPARLEGVRLAPEQVERLVDAQATFVRRAVAIDEPG